MIYIELLNYKLCYFVKNGAVNYRYITLYRLYFRNDFMITTNGKCLGGLHYGELSERNGEVLTANKTHAFTRSAS